MKEHKPQDKKDIQEKIREFAQTPKWKSFLTFLVFITLAFIFWIIQYYQQRFEVEVAIPVRYMEIPAELVVTNQLPDKIDIKISDKGTVLLNYILTKKFEPIEINLRETTIGKGIHTVSRDKIYRYLNDRLPGSGEIRSIFPETIEIEYSPLEQKELPVKLNGILLPAPGYATSDSLKISPETVTVFGDSESLDALGFILTDPIEHRNITLNIDQSINLVIPQNIRLSRNNVQLTLHVEEYTEKTFEIPIKCFNLPEDCIIRFFPSTAKVYVQVGLSHYAKLTESDFAININYNKLLNKATSSHCLELNKFPPEVLNYQLTPEIVEFLVEQKK
jgi:Uncharacterized protein conserved in bacteria